MNHQPSTTNHQPPTTNHRPPTPKHLPLILLGLTVATRFFRLGHQSFWFDEVFSLRVAEKPVSLMVTDALRDAVHPPLYYLLLHPFLQMGNQEWMARLPSALLGIVFVILLYAVTRELLGEKVAWVASLCALLSPYQVYFSQETRMYALLEALTLLSTYLLYRAAHRPRLSTWVAYTVVTFLALMTHYMVAGLVVGHGLWALYVASPRRKGWPVLRRWVGSQLGVALLCLPWIVGMVLRGQSIEDRAVGGSLPTAVWSLVGTFLAFNYGYFEGLFREKEAVLVLVFLAAPTTLYFYLEGFLWIRHTDEDRGVFSLLLLTLLCPVAFSFLVAIRSEYHLPRYFAVAYPSAVAALSCGLVAAYAKRRPVALLAGLLMFLLAGISLRNYYFNPTYFREDWRAVSRFMQTHRRPGDLLVFNASWEDMAFRQYYREPFLKGGLPARLRPSPEEVSRDASRTVAGYRRLWLILCYDHITDPENLVRQWFDRNLENVMQRQFSQIEVLLYRNPEAEPR